jgi:voltage-gated potassium channel Kch
LTVHATRRWRSVWRRRVRIALREAQWIALLVGVVVMMVLGYRGFQLVHHRHGYSWTSLYQSLQLLWVQSGDVGDAAVPPSLQVARFGAPIILGWAAIQAIFGLVRQRVLLLGVRFIYGRHVVVAGLGGVGFRLAASLYEAGFRVAAIELSQTNGLIAGCRDRGIPVVIGDASDPTVLRRASAGRARHVIACSGTDASNLDIAVAVGSLGPQRRTVPTAFVHLDNFELWRVLRAETVSAVQQLSVRLEFFNLSDLAARILLREHDPFPSRRDATSPRLLVFGLNRVGEGVVLHAARLWGERRRSSEPLRITVAAAAAATRSASLQRRHPRLAELAELEPCDPEEGLISEQLTGFDWQSVTAVYLCDDDESASLTVATELRRRLDDVECVVVVQDEDGGVGSLINGDREAFARIHVFGVHSRTLTPELLTLGTAETIARAMHEHYVETQRTDEGNVSAVSWDELPESLRESNRRFAEGVGAKLEATGCAVVPDPLASDGEDGFSFDPPEVEELARLEHDRWMRDLERDGWRRADGPKDPVRRLHPLLVPWEELSEFDRDKDREAMSALPRMLARAGLTIVRAGG